MTFADFAWVMIILPFKILLLKVFLSKFDAELDYIFVPFLKVKIILVQFYLKDCSIHPL